MHGGRGQATRCVLPGRAGNAAFCQLRKLRSKQACSALKRIAVVQEQRHNKNNKTQESDEDETSNSRRNTRARCNAPQGCLAFAATRSLSRAMRSEAVILAGLVVATPVPVADEEHAEPDGRG